MQNGNSSLPIGRVVTKVVRSWAFLQSESEETAIYEEERTSLGLGGVVLNDRPRHAESMPSGVLMKNSRNDVRVAILKRMSPTRPVTNPHLFISTKEAPETVTQKSRSDDALRKMSTEKDSLIEYTTKSRETAAKDSVIETDSAIEKDSSIEDSLEVSKIPITDQ